MQIIEHTKHDIKNIYAKVFLSSDIEMKKDSTREYLSVLYKYKDSKLLELSLREKINNVLNKFRYEESV